MSFQNKIYFSDFSLKFPQSLMVGKIRKAGGINSGLL
jgi:hypothetical protein